MTGTPFCTKVQNLPGILVSIIGMYVCICHPSCIQLHFDTWNGRGISAMFDLHHALATSQSMPTPTSIFQQSLETIRAIDAVIRRTLHNNVSQAGPTSYTPIVPEHLNGTKTKTLHWLSQGAGLKMRARMPMVHCLFSVNELLAILKQLCLEPANDTQHQPGLKTRLGWCAFRHLPSCNGAPIPQCFECPMANDPKHATALLDLSWSVTIAYARCQRWICNPTESTISTVGISTS